MGGHYGSIHVRTEDRDAVRTAVESLASGDTKRFLIAPPIGSWVTVYPEGHGQDPAVSKALAAKLPGHTLIHCLVHDDDVFAYWLFEGGREADTFNSCPDYFGDQNPPRRGGNAAVFSHLLNSPQKIAELEALLAAPRFTFELERQDQFAELLGLPNTAYAYEYLQSGETDGVRQWKKFIHVPDLTSEKLARKEAAAKERAEFKQLQRDGLLLVDERSKRSTNKHFYQSPRWMIPSNTSDILLNWHDHWAGASTESGWLRFSALHWRGEKWSGPDTKGDRLALISPQGVWRAEFSPIQSQIDIWDTHENRLVLQKKLLHSDVRMVFSADENWLFVLGLIRSQTPSTQLHRIALRAGLNDAVLTAELLHFRTIVPHPDGRLLVAVDNFGVLVVIDVESMRIVNQAWIKEKDSLLPNDLREQITKDMTSTVLNAVKDRISPAEAERYRLQSARHSLPREAVLACCFTPEGRWLLCGTVDGLRVLDWNDVRQGPDMQPVPVKFAPDGESVTVEMRGHKIPIKSYVHGIAYDPVRRRALFSGQEGKISYLNLDDGRAGTLLEMPGRIPIRELALTSDRSAIVSVAQRLGESSNMDKPFHFQIWSYPALCRAAGLEFQG